MPAGRKATKRSVPARVSGDTNVIKGTISGGVVVQGRNADVKVEQQMGVDAQELAALFDKVYERINSRTEDPDVDKDEITSVVKQVENEAGKGEDANQVKLARWMEHLGKMAPDILDVIVASLGGPVSGFTVVFKKIAERARVAAATD